MINRIPVVAIKDTSNKESISGYFDPGSGEAFERIAPLGKIKNNLFFYRTQIASQGIHTTVVNT